LDSFLHLRKAGANCIGLKDNLEDLRDTR
jgi:hypothetical protein